MTATLASSRALVAFVLALVAATSLTGCGEADTPEADGSAPASPGPSPSVSLPYPSPPDGGEVKLVEKGFSLRRDGGSSGWKRITYGFVFENTSASVAHYVHVTIQPLDASGRRLKPGAGPGSESGTGVEHVIEYLLPGERVGIGGARYMRPYKDANRVARFKVTVGETEWWPRQNDVWCFPSATATDVALVERRHDMGFLEFVLNVDENPFEDRLGGDVIFRDRHGRIVGGGWVYDVTAAGGRGRAEIVSGIPLNFDKSKTEFYVRIQQPPMTVCGPTGPDHLPGADPA